METKIIDALRKQRNEEMKSFGSFCLPPTIESGLHCLVSVSSESDYHFVTNLGFEIISKDFYNAEKKTKYTRYFVDLGKVKDILQLVASQK